MISPFEIADMDRHCPNVSRDTIRLVMNRDKRYSPKNNHRHVTGSRSWGPRPFLIDRIVDENYFELYTYYLIMIMSRPSSGHCPELGGKDNANFSDVSIDRFNHL